MGELGGIWGSKTGEAPSPLICGRLRLEVNSQPTPQVSITTRQIAIAVAQFEDIVNRGLQSLIDGDSHLHLVATDVPPEEIEATLTVHERGQQEE